MLHSLCLKIHKNFIFESVFYKWSSVGAWVHAWSCLCSFSALQPTQQLLLCSHGCLGGPALTQEHLRARRSTSESQKKNNKEQHDSSIWKRQWNTGKKLFPCFLNKGPAFSFCTQPHKLWRCSCLLHITVAGIKGYDIYKNWKYHPSQKCSLNVGPYEFWFLLLFLLHISHPRQTHKCVSCAPLNQLYQGQSNSSGIERTLGPCDLVDEDPHS